MNFLRNLSRAQFLLLSSSSNPSANSYSKTPRGLHSLIHFLEAIKFSHSIFALPFAVISMLLARRGALPRAVEWVSIILCMVGARTWAMGVNRLVDAKFDAANPRTQGRTIPAGLMSPRAMLLYSLAGATLFIVFAGILSKTALFCSIPLLAVLASYSYTKRFTFLCHFWLGLCLGLAPIGAWVALRNTFPYEMLSLTFAICFWVAGFDILYALQDKNFDRKAQLYSIPAVFGTAAALVTARISHALAAVLFAVFGVAYNLGYAYFVGWGASVVLMSFQHWIMRKGSLQKLEIAFFNLNGWIAVILLFSCAFSLLQ